MKKYLLQLLLKLFPWAKRETAFQRAVRMGLGAMPVIAGGAEPVFNERILREDVVIPIEESRTIWQTAVESSAVLQAFTRTTMSAKQKRIPVLAAFPVAYWVASGGLKQTSKQAWEGKFIEAEELAVIIAIPEDVLDDSSFDIWGEVRPRVAEAIARKFDSTVFFGGPDAPGTFPTALVPAAVAAGNAWNAGSFAANEGGLAEDLNQTFALVEADGYDVTRLIAERRMRAQLRGARDAFGNRLLDVGAGGQSVLDVPLTFAMPGLWADSAEAGSARAIAMDGSQFVVGIRQDIRMRILTEAVISDEDGKVIMNLAQQDMVALRATFRAGWQVPNPITHYNEDEDTRYPAAVLRNEPASS